MRRLHSASQLVRALVVAFVFFSFITSLAASPAAKTASGDSKIDFEQATLLLGGVRLRVELAKTRAQQSRGLMFRHKMGEDEGMLFIYSAEEPLSFWMKNTFLPLSIGFFSRHRILNETFDMTPVKSEMQTDIPTYRSAKPALYALEVNQGWFDRHKIKPGAKFELILKK